MPEKEDEILEIKLEKEQWKAPDPLVGGHKWQATKDPSEMTVRNLENRLVKLKFAKDSIVEIHQKKIIYDTNDVAEGTL